MHPGKPPMRDSKIASMYATQTCRNQPSTAQPMYVTSGILSKDLQGVMKPNLHGPAKSLEGVCENFDGVQVASKAFESKAPKFL